MQDMTATDDFAESSSARATIETKSLSQLLRVGQQYLRSGISQIDRYLADGLAIGKLHSIHGTAASGKTTLALHYALAALSRRQTVIWLECAAVLSAERLGEISRLHVGDKGLDLTHALRCVSITSIEQLLVVLQRLSRSAPSVLVLDDLGTLLSRSNALMYDNAQDGQQRARRRRLESCVFQKLAELARTQACTVLTSHSLVTRSLHRDIFLCHDDTATTGRADSIHTVLRDAHVGEHLRVVRIRCTRPTRSREIGIFALQVYPGGLKAASRLSGRPSGRDNRRA